MAVTVYFILFVRRVSTSQELDYRKSFYPAGALKICRSKKVTSFTVLFINPIIHKIAWNLLIICSMHSTCGVLYTESRQIDGLRQSVAKKNSPEWTFWTQTVYLLNSLSIYEEGERKVATRQTRAIMQPDVWTMSTAVNYARAVGLCRLSRNV